MQFQKVSYDEFVEDLSKCKTFFSTQEEDDLKEKKWETPTETEFDKAVRLPARSTQNSAGYDFFAPFPVSIPTHGKIRFPLCVKCEGMPKNIVLLILNRSSMALKKRIIIDNAVGVIDSDFNKDIWIQLTNNSRNTYSIMTGDKICQGIFVNFLLCDDDKITKKRTDGIGSTGK